MWCCMRMLIVSMWVVMALVLSSCGASLWQRVDEFANQQLQRLEAGVNAQLEPSGADVKATPLPVAPTTLEWQACDDPEVDAEDGLECATLTVPLDYDQPTGATIDLALIRYPASESRQGAILFNPGGPGASGFDYVAQGGSYYVSSLGLEAFDFVGFDPRGVDRSGGVKCQSDAEIDKYMYGDTSPDTPAEEAFFDEADQAFVDGCEAKYGDTLQFYSTANTARDMDAIRAAMGDAQLSFLGVSYGTYLGGVYASMFPDRVRAMVLDAAFEPNGDTAEEYYTTQLGGFEKAMNNWIAWCESTDECAFQAADVGARWDALYEQYNASPVTAPDGRITYQGVIDTATSAALYSEIRWPELAQALADAEKGDVAGVWDLADTYNDRNDEGVYKSSVHSFPIIRCASGMRAPTVDDPEAMLALMQATSPRFSRDTTAEDLSEDSGCADLMPDQPVAEVAYAGNGPILVIGGINDPATPMRWATKLRNRLGSNAALITNTGEGHGQTLNGSSCVDDAVTALFVDLTLPADGLACEPDPPMARPAWWDGVPTARDGEVVLNSTQLRQLVGVSEIEGYASGFVLDGDSSTIQKVIAERIMKDGTMYSIEDPTDIDYQAIRQGFGVIADEKAFVVALYIGSDAFATGEWGSLSAVGEGQGVAVFVTLKAWLE